MQIWKGAMGSAIDNGQELVGTSELFPELPTPSAPLLPASSPYLPKRWQMSSRLPLPSSWPLGDSTKDRRQDQPGPGSLRYWG